MYPMKLLVHTSPPKHTCHSLPWSPVCMYVCMHMLLQLWPENSEEFIEYLIANGNFDEAAVKLADVINNVSAICQKSVE